MNQTSKSESRLWGVLPALVTPMTARQEIDTACLATFTEHLIKQGVHGLIPLGSTGEYYALSPAERQQVIETVIDVAAGRVPVWVGANAGSTREVVAFSRQAEKLGAAKDNHLFYRQVFFVVPGTEVLNLRQTAWYEGGYTFFAVSLDSFERIVTAMKRLENYEFTERFDPQERETIVGLLAGFEQHIRQQNAGNILSTLRGLAVLAGRTALPEDMAEEVENRRKSIRIENFRPSELKKLIDDPDYQVREIARLITPAKPDIGPGELTEAAENDG